MRRNLTVLHKKHKDSEYWMISRLNAGKLCESWQHQDCCSNLKVGSVFEGLLLVLLVTFCVGKVGLPQSFITLTFEVGEKFRECSSIRNSSN